MHQLIDKKNKIVIYLILLIILSTTTNKLADKQKNFSTSINKIDVVGLSKNENLKILNKLNNLFYRNILILNREVIDKIISKHNIVEEYDVKKIYPSNLLIKIKPTKFIAKISGNSQLVVGANGKLIRNINDKITLPYFFGEFNSREFLEFKKKINYSKFNFVDFKNIYFFSSKRWDILTNDNILIKLPQNNSLESLNLAHRIINDSQFTYQEMIDLRINNHLIIK
tara:strand:+ start:1846 stop:2523 length:678 start_codon:yes stop_codon:yes gene_type:complete